MRFTKFSFDRAETAVYWLDSTGRLVYANESFRKVLGYTRDELSDLTLFDFAADVSIEDFWSAWSQLETEGSFTFESTHRRKNGKGASWEVAVFLLGSGENQLACCIGHEISTRKNVGAENALRRSEGRLRQVAKLAKLGYFVWDPETGHCVSCSEEYADLVGMTAEEFMTAEAADAGVRSSIHPDDRALHKANMDELRSGKHVEFEYRILNPSGRLRYVREISEPERDAQGNIIYEIGSTLDITDIRETEMVLHQAQKMEAVGRLIGGVAHDFNNILAIIMGNLGLTLKQIERGAAYDQIESALKASNRGAKLTHRLLAFARKQPLAPETVDIKKLLMSMSFLLRRTIGEDVDFELVTGAGLWTSTIDPHQLENVVLNLAINSRDAMPDGGKLTIEASNARLDDEYAAAAIEVEPGLYVCVSISDTGYGMTKEVVEKAFDPFFTTKEVGKGTGLGLSMAHGFAKQSGGHIKIYSEPGQGTTVKLYLPRSGKAAAQKVADRGYRHLSQTRGEVILVVEDDAALRKIIVAQIRSLGYETIQAEDGPTAIDKLKRPIPIDLLLTDVVLPGGISGREVSQRASKLRPNLPTVFMSGYTPNAIIHHGRLDDGVVILQKPFNIDDLHRTLQKAIGGKGSATPR